MTHFHHTQLSIIDTLFNQKRELLTQLAGNLKLEDVKEDNIFEISVSNIKNQILLSPVEFGDPKISDHYSTTREVPPNFYNPMGGPQNFFVITVDFPFSGSDELFKVIPNGVPYSGSGRIYQPGGNSVSIEITLPQLDKEKTLSEARKLMETTKSVVEASSIQAVNWSLTMNTHIDSVLQQRRLEILNFYN